jgi:hypothetical protein
MTSAAGCSHRAKALRPRPSRSRRRPAFLNVLSEMLGVLLLGVAAFAAVVTAAGWLLAISGEARSATRSAVAWDARLDRFPSLRVLALGVASGPPGMAEASLPISTLVRFDVAPALNPIGALASVLPDMEITGSLGATPAKAAALEAAAQKLPLPRARPRLASLGPTPELGIRLPEDPSLRRTAVYDITARAVYLPNGERLEAHSGLGDLMDDPLYVHRKNRGATPPNVYNLKLRESLFHGVQAIRMTPVNEDIMFGRDGILAHSYLLGPSGQSNGCVSFKDYPRFLRAFLRGEVNRIVVVKRLEKPPVFPGRVIASSNAAVVE